MWFESSVISFSYKFESSVIYDISTGDRKTVQCPHLGPRCEWLPAHVQAPSALDLKSFVMPTLFTRKARY